MFHASERRSALIAHMTLDASWPLVACDTRG
jgi:hypothetical protein